LTFLKTCYVLNGDPTPTQLARLSNLSTFYGIRGFSFEDHKLVVEYDASRIHEAEVLAHVRSTGLPVEPLRPITPGAFNYTGEFRDYAWPIQGLSPVNQRAK
jgi:hypothetical protein